MINRKCFGFHQDNALDHTHIFNNQAEAERAAGSEVLMHPPYSPDLKIII